MEPRPTSLPYLAALLAIVLFCAMDAAMKQAAIAVGAYNALLWRSLIGAALVLPFWLRGGAHWPTGPALVLHLKRGAVASIMALSFFYALVRLPIAEAIALSFIAPIIALLLAAILLGERIEKAAIGASLLGLAGVCIIAAGRSGQHGAHPEVAQGTAALLFSAALYAWNLILQRQQALLARPVEVAFFQSAIVAIILLLASPWLLTIPGTGITLVITGGAVLGIGALMLASWAYRLAEAQALVPLEYSGFLWAALLGWLIFDEAVTMPTLMGAVLIIIGCWIAARRPKNTPQTA